MSYAFQHFPVKILFSVLHKDANFIITLCTVFDANSEIKYEHFLN